jgi:hypothetical protein
MTNPRAVGLNGCSSEYRELIKDNLEYDDGGINWYLGILQPGKVMILSGTARFGAVSASRSSPSVQLRAFSISSVGKAGSPRSTLSTTWVPTGGMTANDDECIASLLSSIGYGG